MKISFKKKGFTLVEMLIVIVIIGILAASLIPRLTGAQGQARDTARISDLNQLGSAVALYSADNSGYPTTAGTGSYVLSGLVTDGYIKSIPTDPSKATTTTICSVPAVSSYGNSTGQYFYSPISNGFVLSANTETPKKGNWIPSDSDIAAQPEIGQGCIKASSTLKQVTDSVAMFLSGGNIMGSTETIYIYAN